jgi:hypothetical protein
MIKKLEVTERRVLDKMNRNDECETKGAKRLELS